MKFLLPTLLAATAVAAAVPAAAVAAPLATESHATTVSAADGALAWSRAGHGRYALVIERGGTLAVAHAATSKSAFDVDLGTDADGRLVAVYSRGGRLYQYDVAAETERRLGLRGVRPSIAAGRLAYVVHRGGRDRLYLRRAGKTRRVYSAPRITGVQLSSKRLAFVTNNAPTKIRQVETLRVQTLAGQPKAIYQARSGGANTASIVGPTFDASGKHLFWARRNLGSGTGNRYVRYSFASGRTAYAIGSDENYSVSYIDRQAGFAVARIAGDDDASAPGGPVIIATTGALRFDARP